MRERFSSLGRIAIRTMILAGIAGVIITAVYIPARWTGAPQTALEREARVRLPRNLRESLNRERVPPPFIRVRMIANQFIAIAIIAYLGRRVLRLRLGR